MSQRKIFVYSDYYKPGYLAGGPIQSISNMCKLLPEFFFYVYTQNFDLNRKQNPYQVQTDTWLEGNDTTKLFYTSRIHYFFSSWKQLFKVKPDVIYINSLFSTATQPNLFQVLFYSLFHKCKIIIAPRGELDEGALSIKGRKKQIFIALFKMLISKKIVFHATTEKEKSFIKMEVKNEVLVAENIPGVYHGKIARNKLPDSSKFIFISRICVKKNLLFALNCLKNINIDGELEFTIVGPSEDQVYWKECETVINQMPSNIKCIVLGPVPHHQIQDKLIENHYMLFPTMAENFGHIIYESLINGVPVIISDNTPWNDGYDNGVFAYSLSQQNQFISKIENFHRQGQNEYNILSENASTYAKSKVNLEVIRDQYFKLFN